MNQILSAIAGVRVICTAAVADETQALATLSNEQAQARQLGIYFGGMASQHDLCVSKGFLAKGDRSAEEIAKSVFEKVRTLGKGPDQSAYVQEGWDTMKKEISEHESFYTQERCTGVAKEWAKIVATTRQK
jgi:hypothetical protein